MKHRKLSSSRVVRLQAASEPAPYIANEQVWPRRMYGIAFDLDTATLERTHPSASWRNTYEDIRGILATHHFDRQQGSVYFGDADKVDPVRSVLAVQDLTRQCGWFAASVNDMRMLRIEENNDLRPAIEDMIAALRTSQAPPSASD